MKYTKTRIFAVLLLLLAALVLPVQASEYTFVYDDAMLLTTTKAAELENMAAQTAAEYGCGIYIVTMYDYLPYGSTVRSAAENFFLTHDLGLGSDDNGVLLLLSMAERDYALIAHGNIGNAAFTDYGKDILSEAFLDDFRYDDWAGGFYDYLSMGEDLLYAAAAGEPLDVQSEKRESGVGISLVMILLIPAIIAGIACGIMAATMKSARQKTNANDYRRQMQLHDRRDRFITRTVVRQKIESSSSSSSGGTRVNAGGFSGKSGKF